jgi:hypothetical protein
VGKQVGDKERPCSRIFVWPFIEQPLSNKAFESWNRHKDENYPEKFCHFSGELSNGETSFNKPILKKNWKKAKELISL